MEKRKMLKIKPYLKMSDDPCDSSAYELALGHEFFGEEPECYQPYDVTREHDGESSDEQGNKTYGLVVYAFGEYC